MKDLKFRKMKVAMFGCGKMSKLIMRYVLEKNGDLVCAFDANEALIGKDIASVMEIKKDTGVLISNPKDIEKVFEETLPDVCIVATMSLLADVKEILLQCAELGVNAITICEEAFFPWNSNPKVTQEIDELAYKNDCTIGATGYQDVFWGNLITTLAGATQKIKKIKGRTSYNVEDYGVALAKAHGAGLTLEEFEKEVASVDNMSDDERLKLIMSGEYKPSYMWNTNGWLCSKLGIVPKYQSQKCIAQTYDKDLTSSTLNMTIKSGDATGMSAIVTTETENGIIIETECVGKVYAPEEFDSNVWTIEGEPNTTITINRPATVELTCATLVNRLIDIVEGQPGYITTDELDAPKFVERLDIVDVEGMSDKEFSKFINSMNDGDDCGCGCHDNDCDCGCCDDDECDCGCCDNDECDCGCCDDDECDCGCCDDDECDCDDCKK